LIAPTSHCQLQVKHYIQQRPAHEELDGNTLLYNFMLGQAQKGGAENLLLQVKLQCPAIEGAADAGLRLDNGV